MNQFTYLLLLGGMASCDSFPDSRFPVSANVREYVRAFKPNDTLYYQDLNGKVDTFLITGIDSVKQTKTNLSSLSPYKEINVRYKQLPVDKWHIQYSNHRENASIIQLYIPCIGGFASVELNFKEFHYCLYQDGKLENNAPNQHGVIKSDTLVVNNKIFTNYIEYGLTEEDQTHINSDNIAKIYWADKYGIIAYKYKDGDFWKRINLK